jgi:hypothetical protein
MTNRIASTDNDNQSGEEIDSGQANFSGTDKYIQSSVNYSGLIGGSSIAGSDQAKVAWSQASSALDMENILIMLDVQGAVTRYLALPGTAAANGRVYSPLCCAFETHPSHKGFGIYLHRMQGGVAAVVYTPQRFEALFNSITSVEDWLASHDQKGLSVFDVSEGGSWEFVPLRLRLTQNARDAMRTVTLISFWGAAASFLIAALGGLGVVAHHLTVKRDNTSTSLKITELASKEVNAYGNTLFELTRVSSLVVKTGGWIERYTVKDGAVSFDVRVPEWVTADVIKALGPVSTEKEYVRNMVIVRKGDAANK